MQYGTGSASMKYILPTNKYAIDENHGFSLIELVVVVTVLGLLTSLAALRTIAMFDAGTIASGQQNLINAHKECATAQLMNKGSDFKFSQTSSTDLILTSLPSSTEVFSIAGSSEYLNLPANRNCFASDGSLNSIFLAPKDVNNYPTFSINQKSDKICQNGSHDVNSSAFNIGCKGVLKISSLQGSAAEGKSASMAIGTW